MQTIKQINRVLEESNSLKLITQAYSEIAALKLQKIRAGIERNRQFFQEVADVFQVVKAAAAKKGIFLPTRRGGTVSILLTSNDRFYGGLETKLTKFFIINSSKYKTDRIVIGKTAGEFLHSMNYAQIHQQVEFKNDLPQFNELKALIDHLSEYQQILVYYSRMQSVLIQNPRVVDIIPKTALIESVEGEQILKYIFEPEVDKILNFFNSQIITLLLEQTFLESELSRTAARLISMDQAQVKADNLIRDQKTELAKSLRDLNNSRLLETISILAKFKGKTYDQH